MEKDGYILFIPPVEVGKLVKSRLAKIEFARESRIEQKGLAR